MSHRTGFHPGIFLAASAGAADLQLLTDLRALLFEGSIVTAQVAGEPDCVGIAKRAASVLIKNAIMKDARTAFGSD